MMGNCSSIIDSKTFKILLTFLCIFIVYVILFVVSAENDSFSIAGGCIGAISSAFVAMQLRTKRQNSSTCLLFWRSLTDFTFACRFILIPAFNLWLCGSIWCTRKTADQNLCLFPSIWFEFFIAAGEAWTVCNGFELYWSITNPFWDFSSRISRYHLAVWGSASIIAFFPFFVNAYKSTYGFWYVSPNHDESAICWLKVVNANKLGLPLWFLFVMPILVCFLGFLSVIAVYIQLSNGLSKSYLSRLRVFAGNSASVVVTTFYWGIFFILYAWNFFVRHDDSAFTGDIFNVLVFYLSSKGYADYIAWLFISDIGYDFKEDSVDDNKELREEILSLITAGIRCTARDGPIVVNENTAFLIRRLMEKYPKKQLTPTLFLQFLLGDKRSILSMEEKGFESTSSTNLNLSESDILANTRSVHSETRRSSGMDMLRTSAYLQAVEESKSSRSISSVGDQTLFTQAKSWISTMLLIDKVVEFIEIEPYHFRRVRFACGLVDEDYVSAFETTLKQRLTQGGASGAFFFFSKNETLIAKSCSLDELHVLRDNAKAYADYFEANPESYIGKIFGIYQLQFYGITLSFFVMNNLFFNEHGWTMNEKYDIKGSWVSRSASPPSEGASATCTFCEQKFIYHRKKKNKRKGATRSHSLQGQSFSALSFISPAHEAESFKEGKNDETTGFLSKCPYTVTGIHEPNVIMKDNDLKYKIRISRDAARNLLNQIQKDCQFLSSLGVMDYSLLMGVHHAEFDMAALHQSEATLSNSITTAGNKATPTPSPPPPPPPPVVSSSRSGRDDSADNENGIMMTVKNPLKGIDVSTVSSPPISSSSNATPSLSSTRSSNKLSVLHRKHEANKVTGPDYYWIGIIDFLQMWNSQKKTERWFKIVFRGADPEGLSAVEPVQYRERFLQKVEDLLDLDAFDQV